MMSRRSRRGAQHAQALAEYLVCVTLLVGVGAWSLPRIWASVGEAIVADFRGFTNRLGQP